MGAPARIAAIGEEHLVEGFGLAGAEVHVAADSAAVRRAWDLLPADVEVVLLTPRAAAAIGDGLGPSAGHMTAVLPT